MHVCMHGRGRTRLVALPEKAGAAAEAELDVAVEAVVADVGFSALVPLDLDGSAGEVKVPRDVVGYPLQLTHKVDAGLGGKLCYCGKDEARCFIFTSVEQVLKVKNV